jgi:GNAT superfamily N-acetyltransferase
VGNTPVSCIYANARQNRSLRDRRKSFVLQTNAELRVCKPNGLGASLTQDLKRKFQLSMPEQYDVAVRQATILDLDLLTPLFDAYRQFYRKPSDLGLARRFLLERFQHNQSIVFLAVRQNGSAVGFTQLFPSFSSASAAPILILNDLFVEPDARCMRVGSLLLSAAANFGRAVGAIRLTLSTEFTNEAAQALYETEGWTRQTDFYVYNLSLGSKRP